MGDALDRYRLRALYVAPPPPPPPPPPPTTPTIGLYTTDDANPQVGQPTTHYWSVSGGSGTAWTIDSDGDGDVDYSGTTETFTTVTYGSASTVTPTLTVTNASGSDTEVGPAIVVSVAGTESLITPITIENAEDTDKTSEIVEFGFPTHGSALTTGQHLKIYDDDGTSGHSLGSLLSNYQIDNKRTDYDGKQRFAKITAIIPSLLRSSSGSAGKLRKLRVYASSDAPPTGTAITIADVQALGGYANGAIKVPVDIDGTVYDISIKDIFDGGSTTFGKTTLWYSAQLWRSGPVVTEWICRAAPRNAGSAHNSGNGIHVEFHVSAYKASPAAVSVGNPIIAIRSDTLPENGDQSRAKTDVAHIFYGIEIQRATSLSDPTLITSDQTNYPIGKHRFSYPRKTPAATITLSSTAIGTGRTITLGSGTWDTDILHAFIRIPGGNGRAMVTARTSSTVVTVEIQEVFSASSYTSGNWVQEGVRHNYNSRYFRRAWIGNRPTHQWVYGDNTSAITPTTKAHHDYLASTEMIYEYGSSFASISHTTPMADLDKHVSADGTIRPISVTTMLDTSNVGEQKMGLGGTGPAPGIGWLTDWQRAGLIKYDADGRRRIWQNGEHFMTYQWMMPRRLSSTPTNGVLPNSPRADCGQELYWNYDAYAPLYSPEINGDNGLRWENEVGHHPAGHYLHYILSGDYVWFKMVQEHTDFVSWVKFLSGGGGAVSKKGPFGQADASNAMIWGDSSAATRGHSWAARCLIQCAAIMPDDFRDTLMNGQTYYNNRVAERWDAAVHWLADTTYYPTGPTTSAMHDYKSNTNLMNFLRGPNMKLATPWTWGFMAMAVAGAKYLGVQTDSDWNTFITWMKRFWVDAYGNSGITWDLWSIAFQHVIEDTQFHTSHPATTEDMYQRTCLIGATNSNGWGFYRTVTGSSTISDRTVGTGRTMTFANAQFTSGGTGTGAWYVGGVISHPGGGYLRVVSETANFQVGETMSFYVDGVLTCTAKVVRVVSDTGSEAFYDIDTVSAGPVPAGATITGSLGGAGVSGNNPSSGSWPASLPGLAVITNVVSSTQVTVDVINEFPATTLLGEVRVPGPHPSDYTGYDEPINSRAMAYHYVAGCRALKKVFGTALDPMIAAMLARTGYSDGSQEPQFYIVGRT